MNLKNNVNLSSYFTIFREKCMFEIQIYTNNIHL